MMNVVHEQRLLDVGTPTVGIDPGTRSVGVALLDGAGDVMKTWSIRPPAKMIVLGRQAYICKALRVLFVEIRKAFVDGAVMVVIEDGPLHIKGMRTIPTVIAMHGEIRGLIMAESWRAGFRVRKMAPISWKSQLTKAERTMKKDKDYVTYWSSRLKKDFKSPDEVDAAMIARRAVE